MKLFLSSSLDKVASLLPETLKEVPKNEKVIFIANAADNHKGEKWWVTSDKNAFIKYGFEVVAVDLREVTKATFIDKLEEVDILHFCGGSVLYLISLIKEKQLYDVIKKYVKEEKIIYSGTSAGSMITAQDLSLCRYDPEGSEYLNVKKIENLSGLGLVDFLIIPHCNNNDFAEANKAMIDAMAEKNQALVFIYDSQVVWVEDDRVKIITVK